MTQSDESSRSAGPDVHAEQAWRTTAEQIDPRLIWGPDWAPLAAALTRAATAGYDVHRLLPELAAAAPLLGQVRR